MPLPPHIEALGRPETYVHRPATVEMMQTHISWVFLAGADVYKVKKPVRFSFLDFSTLERRRHFCHEEVRLNRRLAADVYLGVVSICPAGAAAAARVDGDGLRIGEENDPSAIEYAVHMRRLPHDRTLDQLLTRGTVDLAMMDILAARLVEFHRNAVTNAESSANGTPEAVWRVLSDNYTNVERFRGITIDAADDEAIQTFAREFLDRHRNLFLQRCKHGRIRECHGDLHTDHIYFTEPLVIVDCVEFNPLFRYCDVASDLAFLAMDLDYHDRPDLRRRVVERYVALSNDRELEPLLPFYQCYRAYVRGKVDSLKSVEAELTPPEKDQATASARRHFEIAYRYLWANRGPVMIVIAGLSGTGKSVIAEALSARTGWPVFNSDVVRKELAASEVAAAPKAEYESGLYDVAHTRRTYTNLLERAAAVLADHSGVLLDATFQRRSDREAARRVAAAHGASLLLVECRCADDIVRERLRVRNARGDSISDADWQIYLEQRRRWEAISDDEADVHVVLDSDAPAPRLARMIEDVVRAKAPAAAVGKAT